MALSFGSRTKRERPSRTPDGRMALVDHLREFRNRLFISVCAVIVGFAIAWIFYQTLFTWLSDPFYETVAELRAQREFTGKIIFDGVGTAFLTQAKVSLITGIVIASPVWLYELWAFILPGLHKNEKKWTYVFVSIAGPLFIGGVTLGYYVMPKGFSVLLDFTPVGVDNLVRFDDYISFVIRILLVFGVSFEIPLFVVLLNLAGVVRAEQLARWRSWIIFVTFVFAAIATPSTDPITMCFLAVPMVVLFLVSELICRITDRRRADNRPEYLEPTHDDEISPL